MSLAVCFSSGACRHAQRPRPIDISRVMQDVESRWTAVFPESPRVGLLAPRFGHPALVQRGHRFTIELAERGGPVAVRAALLRGELPPEQVAGCLAAASPTRGDCIPLDLIESGRTSFGPGLARRRLSATPRRPLPATTRSWDLALVDGGGRPQRVHRAVWVFDVYPAGPRRIRIVQVTDFHLGRPHDKDQGRRNLVKVVGELNTIRPDLVLVTGDLVEQGHESSLMQQAAAMLRDVDAPVVVMIGNHDYGHWPKIRKSQETDDGYFNFARTFHADRTLRFSFGGWVFYGFDTGPSVFSPRILVRGLDEQAIATIGSVLDESHAAGARGVVLFSHAPSRTVMRTDSKGGPVDSCCGHMAHGSEALEERLRRVAARGLRIFHLTGHSHWSDVFEWTETGAGRFERWRFDDLAPGRVVRGKLVIVNAPSATFAGLRSTRHARHPGFVVLDLDDREAKVTYRLLGR